MNGQDTSRLLLADGRSMKVRGAAGEVAGILSNNGSRLCELQRVDDAAVEVVYVNPNCVALVRDATPIPAPTRRTDTHRRAALTDE